MDQADGTLGNRGRRGGCAGTTPHAGNKGCLQHMHHLFGLDQFPVLDSNIPVVTIS